MGTMNRTIPIKRAPKMPPVHPGEILREDVLPALGATVTQAAKRLGVSRQTVNAIETEKYDPSLPLAFKLARLFRLRIEDIFEEQH